MSVQCSLVCSVMKNYKVHRPERQRVIFLGCVPVIWTEIVISTHLTKTRKNMNLSPQQVLTRGKRKATEKSRRNTCTVVPCSHGRFTRRLCWTEILTKETVPLLQHTNSNFASRGGSIRWKDEFCVTIPNVPTASQPPKNWLLRELGSQS